VWVVHARTKNMFIAEAWQAFVEESQVPCRLHWPDRRHREIVDESCLVLVPSDRHHVVQLAATHHLF
jgi:hypothetical protein